jgi:hypothetical protein
MSNATVVKRVVCSTPKRDSVETWDKVMELLTQGKQGAARDELKSISGIAASLITEKAPKDSAITAECAGPRTRIYCLFDEDAIDGSDAKEDPLGYDPLAGDWTLSLPCPTDDLAWVQRALKAKSTRITARDMAEKLGEQPASSSNALQAPMQAADFSFDAEAFLKS